jgi:phosphate uptake regulator
MGLVARFYERIGDHAVNVTRRIPVTSGEVHS